MMYGSYNLKTKVKGSIKDNNINEEADYSKENKYPVFIILTYGDNPLGMAISKITGDEWTHVLISFNPQLDPMHSFATRTQKSSHMQSLFGYVYQGTKDKWYKFKQTKYKVYVMYVNKSAYERMQERLNYFATHERESKYDFAGLINVAFNRDSEHHRKYFCSRFVAEILNQGVPLEKLPSLYRPQELGDLNNISLVNAGTDIYNYNPSVTIANMNRVRHKIFNKFVYQERNNEKPSVSEIVAEKYLDDKIDSEHYSQLLEVTLNRK